MEQTNLLTPLLFAVIGLLAGALLKSVLKKSGFPYTVGLFALGLLTGLLNRNGVFASFPELQSGIGSVADTNPDFILYVFLPILIFDAAYEMDMHVFKKTLANATLLAAPGLVIAMLLTAALVMGISLAVPGYETWTWSFALMFGGLISATDPVAVVALLHELRTSKRFSTLVDAESLLNDGTGIVCFMLFYGAYTTDGAGSASPFIQFVEVVAGGALLGFVLARAAIWFITRINSEEMIQNSVIILSAYVTFILSQYYLGVSGVIALVAFGLTVSYTGKPRLRPQVNMFMGKFWELLSHIANTLIFIIVGVIIAEKVEFTWTNFGVLLIIYVGLNLIRWLMVMMLYPVMKRMGYGLNQRESFILSWGGLRGALGMTLALMVSYTPAIPEEIRHQVLFFTAGTVTLTLVFNATTMRGLLRRFGLVQVSSARILMERNISLHIRDNAEKYFDRLQKREALEQANWTKVRNFLPEVETGEPTVALQQNICAELRLRLLDKEQTICHELYEEGVISQASFKRLTNSMNELYDHDGQVKLSERASIFHYYKVSYPVQVLSRIKAFHDIISLYFRNRIAMAYELGRGFIILQKNSLQLLDELDGSGVLSDTQRECAEELREELRQNISSMDNKLNAMAQDYPKAYRHALTLKAIRMLLNNERRTVIQLQSEGVLSEDEAGPMLDSIAERKDSLTSFRHTLPGHLFTFFWKKR